MPEGCWVGRLEGWRLQVKCSDNNFYRVNPVHSFIEPFSTLLLMVTRLRGGAIKVDRVCVQSCTAKSSDVDAAVSGDIH